MNWQKWMRRQALRKRLARQAEVRKAAKAIRACAAELKREAAIREAKRLIPKVLAELDQKMLLAEHWRPVEGKPGVFSNGQLELTLDEIKQLPLAFRHTYDGPLGRLHVVQVRLS